MSGYSAFDEKDGIKKGLTILVGPLSFSGGAEGDRTPDLMTARFA